MHQDKYDEYKGNARKEKVKQLKLSLCKQRSFFANINQSNKNSVKASFATNEMIAKSSRRRFAHKRISFKGKRDFMSKPKETV